MGALATLALFQYVRRVSHKVSWSGTVLECVIIEFTSPPNLAQNRLIKGAVKRLSLELGSDTVSVL